MRQQSSSSLNPTAASLLGFLHAGPTTGWDLVQDVEKTIGPFWNVSRSQVYRELHTLAEAGLVEPGESGPRDSRPYGLTEAGRRAFAEWIGRPPADEIIRFPLLLTVFFSEHVDRVRLQRFLREHELRHLRQLEEYESLVEGLPADSGPWLTAKFGVEYERAVLRWFASIPGYAPVER